ncbi:UNVERIFIED_CONTAM: hypothetical protein NCL1_62527 [Trichonephila clavipes]
MVLNVQLHKFVNLTIGEILSVAAIPFVLQTLDQCVDQMEEHILMNAL